MMLPKEAVEEFKQIYKRVFNEELTDDEASRRANNLVNLYQVVYGDSTNSPQLQNDNEQQYD